MYTITKRSSLLQDRIFLIILTLLFLFNIGGNILRQYTSKNIIFFRNGGLIFGLDSQRKNRYTITCDNLPHCSEAMCMTWNQPNVTYIAVVPNDLITKDSCKDTWLRLWINNFYSGNLFLVLQILWLAAFLFLILHIIFSFNLTLRCIFYILAKISSIALCIVFWSQLSILIQDYNNIVALLITFITTLVWCTIQCMDLFLEFTVLSYYRKKMVE